MTMVWPDCKFCTAEFSAATVSTQMTFALGGGGGDDTHESGEAGVMRSSRASRRNERRSRGEEFRSLRNHETKSNRVAALLPESGRRFAGGWGTGWAMDGSYPTLAHARGRGKRGSANLTVSCRKKQERIAVARGGK